MVTLAEELTLIAYAANTGKNQGAAALDYALAGALLTELALAERITVADGRVVVTSPEPLGVPELDAALAAIAGNPARKPRAWVERLSQGLRDRVLDGLVAQGVLERRQDTVLWVFSATRFPTATGEEPPVELEARLRLVAAVEGSGTVDPRTAALCGLVRAAKLESLVFAGLPADRVKARLKEISEGDWAAEAIRAAVAAMEAALMMAVLVPTIVTASGP